MSPEVSSAPTSHEVEKRSGVSVAVLADRGARADAFRAVYGREVRSTPAAFPASSLTTFPSLVDNSVVKCRVEADTLKTDTGNLESTGRVKLRDFIVNSWRRILPTSESLFD